MGLGFWVDPKWPLHNKDPPENLRCSSKRPLKKNLFGVCFGWALGNRGVSCIGRILRIAMLASLRLEKLFETIQQVLPVFPCVASRDCDLLILGRRTTGTVCAQKSPCLATHPCFNHALAWRIP